MFIEKKISSILDKTDNRIPVFNTGGFCGLAKIIFGIS